MSQYTECPDCHHPPLRHISDGTGVTCLVCNFMAKERGAGFVCTRKFEFKLSQREREQAMRADKGTFPQRTICAECNCEWVMHTGYLCPTGDSTFLPLLDKHLPFIHFGDMDS